MPLVIVGNGIKSHHTPAPTSELIITCDNKRKNDALTLSLYLTLWREHITASVITQIDAKTKLQEYSLKIFKILPIYKLISNTGPRHKPLFKVAVKLKNTKFFTAQGNSKKDAEQNAAFLCFESVLKK